MNEAEKLLKKLNGVPAVELDEWEKEAIREFEAEKMSGEIENFRSLSEIQDEIEANPADLLPVKIIQNKMLWI